MNLDKDLILLLNLSMKHLQALTDMSVYALMPIGKLSSSPPSDSGQQDGCNYFSKHLFITQSYILKKAKV